MTATVPQTPQEVLAKKNELVARAQALGWSQNELGRRAKKDVGHFSRVLAGERVSASAWIEAEKVLARAERRRERQSQAREARNGAVLVSA